jgi:hypothetical protein
LLQQVAVEGEHRCGFHHELLHTANGLCKEKSYICTLQLSDRWLF